MKDYVIKYMFLGFTLLIFFVIFYMSVKEGFIIGQDGFQICSTLNNCITCSSSFGCTWCATDAKCVSDNSANAVCPRQSLIVNPGSCDIQYTTDASGNGLVADTNRVCSASSTCNSCLSIPGCFWCSTQNKCTSSINVYAECKDDMRIYSSFSQCSLNNASSNNLSSNSLLLDYYLWGINAGSQGSPGSPGSPGSQPAAAPVTTVPSIIPILGLSRNSEGSLTLPAKQTVLQSLQSQGKSISDAASRRNVLQLIKTEADQVKALKKTKLNTYVGNSIDYVSDGASLAAIKEYDTRLLDLHDISQHIQSIPLEGFKEGFTLSYETLKSANEYTKESLNISGSGLQYLWLGNLVAIGTIIYFING